jgi:hypothetical protein
MGSGGAVKLLEANDKLLHQGLGEGVQLLRPERDDGDRVASLDGDDRFCGAHASTTS